MGFSITDIADFEMPAFVIAVIFVIVGFLFLFIKPLIEKGGRFSREERLVLWSLNIIIFLFAASIVAGFGYDWYAEILKSEKPYKSVIEDLKTNKDAEQPFNELKFLLKSVDRKLSAEESQSLKAIHEKENLTQFADDLKEINDTSLAILENENFSRIITKYKSFFSLISDRARVVYESRSILGFAETIAIASVGVFLPLLILLWNNAWQTISNTLDKLISLRNNMEINQATLEESIGSVHRDLKELREIGRQLRPLFWITILFIAALLISLAYANFTKWEALNTYVLAVILKGGTIILFLWFLTFLSMYQLLVQPIVREHKHLHLFGLENL